MTTAMGVASVRTAAPTRIKTRRIGGFRQCLSTTVDGWAFEIVSLFVVAVYSAAVATTA